MGHGGRALGWPGTALVVMVLAGGSPPLAQEMPRWAEPARLCLDGDRGAHATFHSILAGGAGRMVIHRAGGAAQTCDYRDGRITRHPADPAYRQLRADQLAFFLDRPCADARPALDANGRAIGWFAVPSCRR